MSRDFCSLEAVVVQSAAATVTFAGFIHLKAPFYWVRHCTKWIDNKSTSLREMLSKPITLDILCEMNNVFCLVALQFKNILITSCDSGTAFKSEEFSI